LIVQARAHQYRLGRSRVVYIGTTKRGINRMAASVATKAPAVLGSHGVNGFDVHVLTCTPRQHVKGWRILERALLLTFRDKYGSVPRFNTHGKSMVATNEFAYFVRNRLERLLDELA
jgi:hypothetical protein